MEHDQSNEQSLKSRRQVLRGGAALLGTLSAGGLLAACGNDSGGAGTSIASSAASGSLRGSGTVTIGTFSDAAITNFEQHILPGFERETGIKPRLLQDEYGTFFEKSFNDAVSKAGQYDVYILDDPWVPQFASAQAIANLGQLGLSAPADLMPGFAELGYWPPRSGPRVKGFEDEEPQLVALPFIGDLQTFSYRTDVFGQAPATWDELVRISKAKATSGQYGYVMRGVAGNPIVTSYSPLLYSFGGAYFDDQWNVTFNDAAGKAAAAFLVGPLKELSPPGVAEFDADQQASTILGGKAWSAILYSGVAQQLDAPHTKVSGKIGHSKLPRQKSSTAEIGIYIAAVSAHAKNTDNALKFMRWYTQRAVQLQFARAEMLPVTRAGFEDRQAQAKNPLLPAALDQLEAGVRARPRTPDWAKIEEILGEALNEALIDGDASGHLDDAAAKATAYLKRQGYYS